MDDKRAFTYGQAVELNLEPQSYDKNIEEGEYTLKLDFKIWGNRCLRCYFTDVNDNNKKYVISAFSPRGHQYKYYPKDKVIDFSEVGNEGNIFKVTVGKTKTGWPAFLTATLIS